MQRRAVDPSIEESFRSGHTHYTIIFCEKSNGISVGLITFNLVICINVMLGFQIRGKR